MRVVFCFFLVLFTSCGFSQDFIKAVKSTSTVTVDGIGNDAVWAGCPWYTIDQPWLFTLPSAADFTGRYKLAWDQNYLYLLTEITDDILSDDHTAALTQWYDDDCIEIFLDENRSKGNHQYNYNAFAYHVSLTYDVVDYGTDQNPHLYNDNVYTQKITTGNTTVWECRIKVFPDTFVYGGTNTPVTLTSGKLLGFSLAYCDNDSGTTREGFIGSGVVPGTNKNVGYITADYFQELQLVDLPLGVFPAIDVHELSVFPNPVRLGETLTLDCGKDFAGDSLVTIADMTGKIINQFHSEINEYFSLKLDATLYKEAVYILTIQNNKRTISKKIATKAGL